MGGQAARRATPRWAVLAVLATVVVAVYGQTARFDYVFDDQGYLLGSPEIRQGLTPDTLRWALTSGDFGNWFPLTRLSWLADVEAFGMRPGPAHAVNAALHLAGAWCLFLVLESACGLWVGSAVLAALWAAHPLQVEAVAWISERSLVLAALFLWLTLGAYLAYARRPGAARLLVVVLCAALSLLSKPIAIALPALLLLLDWWPLGRLRRNPGAATRLQTVLLEKLPFAVLAVAFGIKAIAAQSAIGALASTELLPLTERAASALRGVAWYVVKAAVPAGLGVYHPLPVGGVASWSTVAAAAVLAAITLGAVRVSSSRPRLLAGWLWFALALLPVSGLVQTGTHATADRFAYIPLAGLLVLASGMQGARPGWGRAAGAVVLLVFAGASFVQAGTWRNELTLFTRAEAIGGSESWIVHDHLGGAYERAGDWNAAVRHRRAALRLAPELAFTHNALGETLARRGELAAAEARFREALQINPDLGNAGRNLSAVRECAAAGAGAGACFNRLRPRREGVPAL